MGSIYVVRKVLFIKGFNILIILCLYFFELISLEMRVLIHVDSPVGYILVLINMSENDPLYVRDEMIY